jgi:hypothetical protein
MASTQYLPLPDQAARQLIDSTTLFDEYRRVHVRAKHYSGGMHWKKQGKYEYLVRTTPDNRSASLGPRSAETEKTHEKFTREKAEVEQRLRALRAGLAEAERLNKAVRVGRTPNIVVDILQALQDTALDKHFIVVGTHALYAYETAAGVRIAPSALATRDVDLLWDARKQVQFLTDMKRLDASMLSVLRRADPSFIRMDGHNETAINSAGFQVDFLRRMRQEGDPHPFRLSADEQDLWPVQANRAAVLNEAPPFDHVVVSATGRMALMRTIDPAVFVRFKQWLATQVPDRESLKRNRDRSQAGIVQALLDERLLVSKIPAGAGRAGE